jgi:hypothetical protein
MNSFHSASQFRRLRAKYARSPRAEGASGGELFDSSGKWIVAERHAIAATRSSSPWPHRLETVSGKQYSSFNSKNAGCTGNTPSSLARFGDRRRQ